MNSQKIAVVTICPGCFARYAPNTIRADYPICPDCNSEAKEIELMSHGDFMSRISPADLEQMRERWSQREDLLPMYKQDVLNRIDELVLERSLIDAQPGTKD